MGMALMTEWIVSTVRGAVDGVIVVIGLRVFMRGLSDVIQDKGRHIHESLEWFR